MSSDSALPLVTLALPLYRSMPFFDVIVENIETLDYPNLEILIGDRHLLDAAVEQLKARFPSDPRMRYLTAVDNLTWVEHYNALLAAASGKYFLWMPHDDIYAAGYIRQLVDRLEARPAAVLAFGYMEAMSTDRRRPANWESPPLDADHDWSVRNALLLVLGWNIGFAMRGVFRRSAVVDAGLWIRPTTGLANADLCWLFGLALMGHFEFVAEARCLKRFHSDSTSGQWKPLPFTEQTRVLSGYLLDVEPSRFGRAWGLAILWFAAALSFGATIVNAVAGRRLVTQDHLRSTFRRLLQHRPRTRASH